MPKEEVALDCQYLTSARADVNALTSFSMAGTLVGPTYLFLRPLLLPLPLSLLFSQHQHPRSFGQTFLSDSPGRPSSLHNITVLSHTEPLSFIPFTTFIMHLAITILASALLIPLGLLGSAPNFALATPPGGKKCLPCELEKWMHDEETVALRGVLNNIGCESSKVKGAGCGIVVASPSKKDPDCKFCLHSISNQDSSNTNPNQTSSHGLETQLSPCR